MLWKCCTQYASKFGKLSSGCGTGKGQLSFQSQRKAMPQNVQTTIQLHSSHRLVSNAQYSSNQASAICEPWMFKLILEKAVEPEIKLLTSTGSLKKQESSRKNIYFWFIGYANAFDCVDHNKLWEILQEMGIPDDLSCLVRNVYAGQEPTVRTGHGTTDWFQIGNGVRQGSYIVTLLI